MTPSIEIVLRVAAIICGTIPVVHTQWNKYKLKRFENATGRAAETDPKIDELRERRARQGSDWKAWKSILIGLAIVLGAASFFLAKLI